MDHHKPAHRQRRYAPLILCLTLLVAALPAACGRLRTARTVPETKGDSASRLPTGAFLDPAGTAHAVGSLPLALLLAPEQDRVVLLLNGWREQGVQVVERTSGRVLQTLLQPAAFLGLAFAPDGRTLFVSGGNQDVVYRYDWRDGAASLRDSIILAHKPPDRGGTRYPAGIALSRDGRTLYVAENLADSLAVIDVQTGRVRQRLPVGRYPYAVSVGMDDVVYASAWGEYHVAVFVRDADSLRAAGQIKVGRHPSALLLSADGRHLYAVSGSTDQVAVVNTRTRAVVTRLHGPPPAGPGEGSTPNALALSPDNRRLYVAEADNNAVAVWDVSDIARARMLGRVPVGWYPAALVATGDTLLVVNGKGDGSAANPELPQPGLGARDQQPRAYTLGQLSATLTTLSASELSADVMHRMSARVARANGWTRPRIGRPAYPPFEHVIYIIKENRTYDQIFGDLPQADGDTTLLFFPRAVTPNHHALAERFGIFDRFFVNAEVSADGHNWSMAAYTTDYTQKTVPSNYSGRGRNYDYEGTNRGRVPAAENADDVAEPANGYLWNLAERAGVSFRNYGEFVIPERADPSAPLPSGYRGTKPFLARHTHPTYPGYNLDIPDQQRADVYLAELREFVHSGRMPQLQILRLPNDHTAGARPGAPTPRAYLADNDLALGRIVEAITHSPFWRSTVIFVLEDDAQNGPDHVDSHRSPLLVISPYNRGGVFHRFANTTDVIATMSEILGMGALSQFDYYGRPLRGIFSREPDFAPYKPLRPEVDLDERNPERGAGSQESMLLDLEFEDRSDDALFNRILWRAIKGDSIPYPGARRMSALEWKRGR